MLDTSLRAWFHIFILFYFLLRDVLKSMTMDSLPQSLYFGRRVSLLLLASQESPRTRKRQLTGHRAILENISPIKAPATTTTSDTKSHRTYTNLSNETMEASVGGSPNPSV